MNKGQAEIAWRETLVKAGEIIETLAGEFLPHNLMDSDPNSTARAVASGSIRSPQRNGSARRTRPGH